jgi:hypothetical protein
MKRRDALVTLTAAASLPASAAAFTEAEQALTARLVDLIIPRTDTPGAVDTKVPQLIEERAGVNAVFAANWRKMLGTLPDAEALDRAAKANTPEFKLLKDTTIDLYYSTREGLQQELGWNANTYLAEFRGCEDH